MEGNCLEPLLPLQLLGNLQDSSGQGLLQRVKPGSMLAIPSALVYCSEKEFLGRISKNTEFLIAPQDLTQGLR